MRPAPSAVTARAEQLRAAVAHHKAQIRFHRSALQTTAAALAAFEADCQRRGIQIVRVPVTPDDGVGAIHGHPPDPDA